MTLDSVYTTHKYQFAMDRMLKHAAIKLLKLKQKIYATLEWAKIS